MKAIIKTIMLAVIMAAFCGTVSAQAQQGKKQRISREQLAEVQARHIANQMAFDDATSQKFMNAYCDYQRELWALGPRQSRKGRKAMNDADTEKAIKNRFAQSQKILDIREKYYERYSKFLTQKQIQRVYELERQMMKRLGNHKRPMRQRQERR